MTPGQTINSNILSYTISTANRHYKKPLLSDSAICLLQLKSPHNPGKSKQVSICSSDPRKTSDKNTWLQPDPGKVKMRIGIKNSQNTAAAQE